MSTWTSGSYTKPSASTLTAGLNGLNWQVQVWPCSLAMVTVPPCFGAGPAPPGGPPAPGDGGARGALFLAPPGAGRDPPTTPAPKTTTAPTRGRVLVFVPPR